MGYYTSYQLEVKNVEDEDEIIDQFRKESDNAAYAIDSEGNANQECKWYDHEDDLRLFSKKHPTALFKLIGEGEEAGDLWIEYYKNGKMQRCKAIISYDEFNESLLR